MSKFDELYNKIASTLTEQTLSYGSNTQQTNTNLTPQQQVTVSDAISKLIRSIPKTGTVSPATDLGRKIGMAGNKALQVIGQMPVKDVVEIIKNVIKAPVQAQQAVLSNLKQAGINTIEDVTGILKNIAKQKGASDQEISQILSNFDKERKQFKQKYPNITGSPMSADQAAAGYESPQPMSADRAAAGYEY